MLCNRLFILRVRVCQHRPRSISAKREWNNVKSDALRERAAGPLGRRTDMTVVEAALLLLVGRWVAVTDAAYHSPKAMGTLDAAAQRVSDR